MFRPTPEMVKKVVEMTNDELSKGKFHGMVSLTYEEAGKPDLLIIKAKFSDSVKAKPGSCNTIFDEISDILNRNWSSISTKSLENDFFNRRKHINIDKKAQKN